MSEKLKPCPWGHDAITQDIDGEISATCGHGCFGDWWLKTDDWNRRAPLTVADAMTVPEVRALVDDLIAEAEEPCEYGDNCPPFGTRHGQCRACKARENVAPFLAAMEEKP